MPKAAKEFEFRFANVLKIKDGDTITVSLDLGFNIRVEQVVRLLDINAAEMSTPEGPKALAVLEAMVKVGDAVRVVTVKKPGHPLVDRYGRILARVTLSDGRDVSSEMLRSEFVVKSPW